jgi:hypothetical protein
MTDEGVQTSTAARLDSSAAMVRAEVDYLDATLRALVTKLSTVPGLRMAVSYRHGKLRRLIGDLPYINDLNRTRNPIHKVVVSVGRSSYWLQSEHGLIKCGHEITQTGQGRVKDELSFSDWARTLFDEIARQNYVNHESMVALRHLVEQDRVQ